MSANRKERLSAVELDRRDFVKAAAAGIAVAGAMGAPGQALAAQETKTTGLPLKMAGYRFDRVRALAEGKVQVEGCDASFETAGIGDMNTDVFSGAQSRDVTEIGLHPFMLAYANEGFRDYTLLPIFPLRIFRHKSVFIRKDRGIEKPQDLAGKTIGTPGYSSTSLTWIRGIFQDEYGLRPQDIHWVVAKKDSSADVAGKSSKQENVAPDGISIVDGPAGMDESELLASGKVDALFHAAEPQAYIDGHANIARLFPDSRSVERAYFEKTRIFPIMHAVAIKKTVLAEHPWLAAAVFNAYSEAKRANYAYLAKMAWVDIALPWIGQELEETRSLMGDDWYSYGIDTNHKVLTTLCRYSFEQGLCKRQLTIEDLFAPEGLELAEVSGRRLG